MILGVDHIALSCSDLDEGIDTLAKVGYEVRFQERDVPNPPQKTSFLRKATQAHSLACCQSRRGIAIELTQHGERPQPPPATYRVIFDGPLPESTECRSGFTSMRDSDLGLTNRQLIEHFWRPFQAVHWSLNRVTRGTSIVAVGVPARDLDRSESFWTRGLGWQPAQRGGGHGQPRWSHLTLPSPRPSLTTDVFLIESPPCPRPALDDTGFPCLALLSSHLEADADRLRHHGASEVGEPFAFFAGERPLSLCMVRDPDGHLVELIQPSRRAA